VLVELSGANGAALAAKGSGKAVEFDPGGVADHLSTKAGYFRFKRALDILLALLVLPAIAVVVALAAAVILITMGRPIFFIQDRVGLGGKVFRMMKLRTMSNAIVLPAVATQRNDPRITPFGQFLRLSHIDELPQIWNILRGDMSFIGPRPEQPALVERYREAIPGYDLRHLVRPGLSGLSQTCYGYAGDLAETMAKTEYDLYYVMNCGPALDARIVVKTLEVYLDPTFAR
jgi:lipopolysaccharide/colanic/teichoic acid biosynthesis glycosyltransferase